MKTFYLAEIIKDNLDRTGVYCVVHRTEGNPDKFEGFIIQAEQSTRTPVCWIDIDITDIHVLAEIKPIMEWALIFKDIIKKKYEEI